MDAEIEEYRKSLNAGTPLKDSMWLKDIMAFYLIKSEEWAYEKEWRIAFPERYLGETMNGISADGIISMPCIAAVYLGYKGSHHKAIPPEKMMKVREHIDLLPTREKRIVALLSYTGMRLEEVLGICWDDFDFQAKRIVICRAVIHPTRNQPEVKLPKTTAGNRVIPLPDKLVDLLAPLEHEGYVLGGEKPLTYQQQKRSFDKIRKTFGLEDYSAHDFRDTCATEWREAGMSIETISKMLGHANSTVTERCYVKFREKSLDEARGIMNAI